MAGWLALGSVFGFAVGVAFVFALAPRRARYLTSKIEQERQFSSNASHQLKTPLTALRFRLDDLALWPETPDVVKAELFECVGEVDRLAGNVEDLLSLARDGTPAPTASAAAVDLADAAASAVGRWRRLFVEQNRALGFSAPPEAVLATTAPRPMLQVIDVLIENALSHGSGDAQVRVAVVGDRGVIYVGDAGELDPSVADKIFDRAFRSATSAGSGIGLALARTIVDAIEGRLTVESTKPTCFALSFALAQERP